jgi:hypothetical protein
MVSELRRYILVLHVVQSEPLLVFSQMHVIVRSFGIVVSVWISLSSGLLFRVLYGCRFCLTKRTGKSHRGFSVLL